MLFASAAGRPGRALRRCATPVAGAVLLAAGPLAVAASATTGGQPHATTATAPIPPNVYVASAGDSPSSNDQVTVLDATAPSSPLGTLVGGSGPIALASSPDGSTMYELNHDDGTIVPIDTASRSARTPIAVSLGSGRGNAANLQALAVSPDGSLAYLVDGLQQGRTADGYANSVVVVALTGSSRGNVVNDIAIPSAASLSSIALTPDGTTALVVDQSRSAVVPIELPTGTRTRAIVDGPITVGRIPNGIAVTPDGATAIVADSADATISAIDLTAKPRYSVTKAMLEPTVTSTTPNAAAPQAVSINPAGTLAYVTDNANGVVVPVSVGAGDLTPGKPIALGATSQPFSVAFAPDGKTAFVADFVAGAGASGADGEVAVVDVASGSVSKTDVAAYPQAVAVTPDIAPIASFTVSAAPAGVASSFDASASRSLVPGALSYTWTFGDGTAPVSVTTPTIKHVYGLAGTYTATLAVADAYGTSTRVVYTGQQVVQDGGPSAGVSHPVAVVAGRSVTPPVAYVTNATDGTVTPILAVPASNTPGSGDTGAPIAVGSHPVAVAVSPDGRTAYVVNFGDATITPIDTASNTAPPTSSWVTGLGSEPVAIAITPDGSSAYVANSGSGSLSRVDLGSRTVDPATIAIGGTPTAVAVAPNGTTAYVTTVTDSDGDGAIVPVSLASSQAGNPVAVGKHPVALAITPDGKTAYVADQGTSTVAGTVVPVALTGTPTAGTPVALNQTASPSAIAIASDGKDAYVTDTSTGNVYDVAIPANTVTSQSSGGGFPDGIAVLPGGSALYVAQGGSAGQVTQLYAPSSRASAPQPITVGQGAQGIAITPDQAPVARLTVSPTGTDRQYSFDASATTFPSATPAPPGATTSYLFDFGDGTPALRTTAPTAVHTYTKGGSITASVTVTDAVGTSTSTVTTGQTASLHGGPSAVASVPVGVSFTTPVVTGVSPSSGPVAGNTTITVTGSNLFGPSNGTAPTVTVGGVAATAVAVNADGTQVTATVPAASKPATVDVVVSNGTSSSPVSTDDRYTYLGTTTPPTGAPTVTAVSPASGPITGTSGVTISGTDLGGATQVLFGTVPATSYATSAGGTSIVAVAPAQQQPGTVDVTVTTTAGTSAVSGADGFTYLAGPAPSTAPVVLGVSPASGPQGGGDQVTITGTHFTGATRVLFGNVAARSFSVTDDRTVVATTSAAGAAGTVDVTVSTPQGTSPVDAVDGYTYLSSTTAPAQAPTITGLSVHAGPTAGGTTVVITGSQLSGTNAVYFGQNAVPQAGITVNGAGTAITVASPAGAAGTVDVVVNTVTGGSSSPTPADTFAYEPPAAFLPVVTSVAPSAGSTGSTVTITGRYLSGLTGVRFGGVAVSPDLFTVNSAGTVATAPAPAQASSGPVDVVVTTPIGSSVPTPADVFTYVDSAPPASTAPVLSGVAPAAGPVAGGTGVALRGSGLGAVTTVRFGTAAASTFAASANGTLLVAVAPAASSAGTVPVTVTSSGGTSGPVSYTYESAPVVTGPVPVVSTVSPSSGSAGGGQTVTITGSNLTGTTQVFFGPTAGTNVVVASNGLSLTVVAPAGPAGPVDITVVTPAGPSAVVPGDVFSYPASAATAPPVVGGLSPKSGSANGGDTITVTGSGFAGASSVLFGTTPGTGIVVAADGLSLTVVTPQLPVGQVDVRVVTPAGQSAANANDVFTAQPTGPRGGGFVSVSPTRILDTRDAKAPVGAGQERALHVLGVGGVPTSGVSAVALHVTITDATAATYVLAYPQGASRPLASNLNPKRGLTVSNLLYVSPGTAGNVAFFNQLGSVDVVVDVQGYVTASPTDGGAFVPVDPSRLYDSRSTGQTALPARTPRTIAVGGHNGVPTNAAAVVLNVTGTDATAPTALTLYQDGIPTPLVSDLNLLPRQTVANRVVVPLGSDGSIDVYSSAGTTAAVLDVSGYYLSPTAGRTSGGYTALGPVRVLDTRTVQGGRQPLGQGATYTLQLGSDLPAGATAVILNLTSTGTTRPTFVTAYPGGQTRPLASDLNGSPGVDVPNLVVVKVGPGGVVELYNDQGSTDLVADLQGYFQ